MVGAGIVGLKLARHLAQYGLSVAVLEGTSIGDQAASARNQGCLQRVVGDYLAMGDDAAPMERLGLENRRMIREQIAQYGIECDLLETHECSLICSDTPGSEQLLSAYRAEAAARQADGFSCHYMEQEEARAKGAGGHENGLYIGGICHDGDMAATFHSGKYLFGLARGVGAIDGVEIWEHARVVSIADRSDGVTLTTATGRTVAAAHGFIATNACVPQFVPRLADCLRAERGQMAVTEPLDRRACVGCAGVSGIGVDTPPTAYKDIPEPDGRWRLMVTGCRWREHERNDSIFPQFSADGSPHPRLESEGMAPSQGHQDRIDRAFARVFPHLAAAGVAFAYRWGGLQCFTADDHPIVGPVSTTGRLHTLAGLSGRGNGFSDVL